MVVDRGYLDYNPVVQIILRGKYKSLNRDEKRLLKDRQAIQPLIGNTRSDHPDKLVLAAERRLQGAMCNTPHAMSCAAGYNIRWLLRAIVGLGLGGLFYASELWSRA